MGMCFAYESQVTFRHWSASALHQSVLLSPGKEMERKRKVEGKMMEGREVEGGRRGMEEGPSLSLRQ